MAFVAADSDGRSNGRDCRIGRGKRGGEWDEHPVGTRPLRADARGGGGRESTSRRRDAESEAARESRAPRGPGRARGPAGRPTDHRVPASLACAARRGACVRACVHPCTLGAWPAGRSSAPTPTGTEPTHQAPATAHRWGDRRARGRWPGWGDRRAALQRQVLSATFVAFAPPE